MIHNLFKNKTFIFLIIFSSFLIILGFLPNNTLNAQSNRQETYKQLNLFGDVFQRVQARLDIDRL